MIPEGSESIISITSPGSKPADLNDGWQSILRIQFDDVDPDEMTIGEFEADLLEISEIQAKEILFTKALLNKYIADYTDQPIDKIAADTDRDFFMTPYEAKDYGIIDEVIQTKTSHIPLPAMPSLRS